ncbi:MAG: DUF4340 domain-containing protein [Bdellovibrionia bacterium]
MTSILTTLAAGCTQSTSPRVPESNKSREAPNSLFNYKVNEITELTLGKFDPATSEHWMTVIKRTDAALKKRANTATWEIISLPDGNTTRDRKANATFIMHLLDSLQGLRVVGDAPNGSLESLGLDPPRFVVRLKTNSNIHEFRIGTLSDDKLGNYFTTDQKKVIIASGSALKMLPMIKNFEYLRDRSWTPFSPDDVDEFILSDRGKPFFYAQREGSQWNDKNHRPITFAAQNKFKESARQDAESLLKTLTEIQPLGFIDDPVQVEEIKSRRSILPTYEAKLINRHGTEVSLKLVRSKKKVKSEMNQTALYGLSSTRPSTLFILDPKILTAFENSKALQPQHN